MNPLGFGFFQSGGLMERANDHIVYIQGVQSEKDFTSTTHGIYGPRLWGW